MCTCGGAREATPNQGSLASAETVTHIRSSLPSGFSRSTKLDCSKLCSIPNHALTLCTGSVRSTRPFVVRKLNRMEITSVVGH